MAHIEDLGEEGDVVTVAEGYARNYLYPKKLAAPVTAATRRQLEKKQMERAARHANELKYVRTLAGKIGGAECTIAMKTGPEGKLYGSVGRDDIVAALKAQGIELDKNCIELSEPIKKLDLYKLPVKLHKDVTATLKVWIVEE